MVRKSDPAVLDKAAAECKELIWSYGYYVTVRDTHTPEQFEEIKARRLKELEEERAARKHE